MLLLGTSNTRLDQGFKLHYPRQLNPGHWGSGCCKLLTHKDKTTTHAEWETSYFQLYYKNVKIITHKDNVLIV